MSDSIVISSEEYDQFNLFHKGLVDHVFIKHPDQLNYYLVCHGCKEGKILFNNKFCNLSEIVEEIKFELHITHTIFIDVICCYGLYQTPHIESGIRIKSAYSNKELIHCTIKQDKLHLHYNDSCLSA